MEKEKKNILIKRILKMMLEIVTFGLSLMNIWVSSTKTPIVVEDELHGENDL